MKFFLTSIFIALFGLAFVSCEKEESPSEPTSQTPAKPESTPEPPTKPAQPEPANENPDPESPALTNAEIDKLIFGESGPDIEIENLPPKQQAVLRDAIQKAIKQIDTDLLAASIAGQFNIGETTEGLPLIPQGASEMRVLSPEEVKEMGIDLEAITGAEPGSNVVITSTVIIGGDQLPEDFKLPEGVIEQGVTITQSEPIEIEENNPEMGERIQSLLESGDSDALAEEFSNLIQNAIDTATIQQLQGAPDEE